MSTVWGRHMSCFPGLPISRHHTSPCPSTVPGPVIAMSWTLLTPMMWPPTGNLEGAESELAGERDGAMGRWGDGAMGRWGVSVAVSNVRLALSSRSQLVVQSQNSSSSYLAISLDASSVAPADTWSSVFDFLMLSDDIRNLPGGMITRPQLSNAR